MLTCYFCKYMYIMFRYCLGMHYVYKLTLWAVTNDKIIMMITVIITSLEYIIISNYALVDSKQA